MRRRLHRREKKKRKQIVIISLALLLFISVGYGAYQTTISLKAKGNVYNKWDLCYKTSDNGDGTVSITNYDESCGTEINIPKKIKGKIVTQIANGEGWNETNTEYSKSIGVFANRNITKVTFPDTLTTIGDFAFYRNKLTEIILPNSVIFVGRESFKNNQISYIKYSNNLKTINNLAFADNLLTNVEIPSSVTQLGLGAFTKNKVTGEKAYIYGKNSDGSIDYSILNSYAGDYTEDDIVIPNVNIVDSYSFRDNQNKSCNITIPNSVTIINYGAFAWNNINSITIPSSVNSIGYNAFIYSTIKDININRKENAISGSPWGATSAIINWIGTN